jgi:hypothetical protein
MEGDIDRGQTAGTPGSLELERLKGHPWQLWLAAAGVLVVVAGCLGPWTDRTFNPFPYGFQTHDGKAMILVAVAAGAMLWRYTASLAVPTLLFVALIGLFMMTSGALTIDSVDASGGGDFFFGDNPDGGEDETTILDSWGLILVVLGGLMTMIGAGLLALERAGHPQRPA